MPTYPCQFVYCADIGSMQTGRSRKENRFGWAGLSIDPNGQQSPWEDGDNPEELADAVADGLNKDAKVALGFECPLWIPIREEPKTLTSGRVREGSPSWASQTGATVLTTGLAQVSWILQKIREKPVNTEAFLDWNSYGKSERGLFIWEAFVSGEAKFKGTGPNPHIEDARTGVRAFINALPDLETAITAPLGSRTRSLVGAALLWADWSKDPSFLHQACKVIRP